MCIKNARKKTYLNEFNKCHLTIERTIRKKVKDIKDIKDNNYTLETKNSYLDQVTKFGDLLPYAARWTNIIITLTTIIKDDHQSEDQSTIDLHFLKVDAKLIIVLFRNLVNSVPFEYFCAL